MDQGKLPPRAHLLRLSLLGLNFSLSIFTGLALGWAAQEYLHWGDGAMIAGMVLGIVAGYWGLFTELKKLRVPKPPPHDPR